MEIAEHYRMRAESLLDLARELNDDHCIPATPAWNLRELIAHLAGVAADVSQGRVKNYAQPLWTAQQVSSRAAFSRQDLIAEWKSTWAELSALLDDPVSHGLEPSFSILPLIDVIAHEHDIRESVGVFDFSESWVWSLVEQRRLEVLTVQCGSWNQNLEVRTHEGDHWVIGSDENRSIVAAGRYELWRSLEGRRSRETVRNFGWTNGPGIFLEHWVGSVFEWPNNAEG